METFFFCEVPAEVSDVKFNHIFRYRPGSWELFRTATEIMEGKLSSGVWGSLLSR